MARKLKNALIVVEPDVWEKYKQLQKNRKSSASRRLRAFMARELRKAERSGEMA